MEAKKYLDEMTKDKQVKIIEQAKFNKEKKKILKETTRAIHIRVPNEVYENFQKKLKKMRFDETEVVVDLLKDWSEY